MYNELLIMATQKDDITYTWFGKYDTNDSGSMNFLRKKTKEREDKFSLPPFELILKLDAPTEEYAHNFLQYVNFVTKPFYQNGIGSPKFKNMDFDTVKKLFTCLWHLFEKGKQPYELVEPIYNHFQHDKPKEGYIYIINNIKTVKVGLSDDPERRYYLLKRDNEIYHSAQLEYQMKTENMVLAEALCHAKLYEYKTSNPLITSRSKRCDKGWDEHFNITVEEAYEKIKEIVEKI